MNWTQIEGKWEQLKGDAKVKWAQLTEDDIRYVGGKFDNLVGRIVERYGVERKDAQRQVSDWAERVGARMDAAGRAVSKDQHQPPR